jgi:hypothetical protein
MYGNILTMKKTIQSTLLLAVFTLSLMFANTAGALAATAPKAPAAANPANNGQALEIAPPVIYLTVSPGQTVNTQILIRDISSGSLLVTGQVNDFVASGQDGTPKVILDNDTNNPYGMKNWVAPLPKLLLVPREIKSLPVTIKVPADASPGGHYGVVRFTATAPSLEGNGVSLSASLGSLILLTVSGKTTQSLSTQSFTVSKGDKTGKLFESGPVSFTEVLKNNGNVHVQPVGQVTVTDLFGKKLAAVNVNTPPGNILPGSTRKFTQKLDSSVIGNKHLFGRYKAVMKVTYGTNKQVLTSTTTFWVIPYKLIGIVILILIVLFFLIRFLLRRYNRYILKQGGRQKTPKNPPTTPQPPQHPQQ